MLVRSLAALALIAMAAPAWAADERDERLLAAARRGDVATVEELLGAGVAVNAKTRYGVTPLTYASQHGHVEVVNRLLEAGADVNAADTFYHGTPLSAAISGGHAEVAKLLLAHGAKDLDGALESALYRGSAELAGLILDAGEVRPQTVRCALQLAQSLKNEEIVRRLKDKFGEGPPPIVVPPETLAAYVGQYSAERSGEYEVQTAEGNLLIGRKGNALFRVQAKDASSFLYFNTEYVFESVDGKPVALVRRLADESVRLKRLPEVAAPTPQEPSPAPLETPPDLLALSNWPQFRGAGARGVSAGQNPPVRWDVPKNESVRWKTPIPGLANSCPIVWQDKVFVTTAVRLEGESQVRTGLYGDVEPVADSSPHAWRVYCLNKNTGEILWERTACEGLPKVKRHPKSTHANCTPVTDGEHVLAFFASEGLYCYDVDGKLLWQKDLGVMDSGWFFDPESQWGFASSPILFEGMVILQCDRQKDSFITALRVTDGGEVWRTPRDEISTWGTPTVCETPAGPILVTGGTRYARGYNPRTGEELWRLGDHSEIAIPTPFYSDGLIYVASGYRPIKPIYAIRPTARGDISLPEEATLSEHIAWSRHWGGPYTPTPLAYGGLLYVCDNDGILTCFRAANGEQVYRQRLRSSGAASFSASPVASDERLYFPSEEGVVLVVRAGPKFELLAANPLGEECLATPAITERMLIVRTRAHLVGLGESATAP